MCITIICWSENNLRFQDIILTSRTSAQLSDIYLNIGKGTAGPVVELQSHFHPRLKLIALWGAFSFHRAKNLSVGIQSIATKSPFLRKRRSQRAVMRSVRLSSIIPGDSLARPLKLRLLWVQLLWQWEWFVYLCLFLPDFIAKIVVLSFGNLIPNSH
jgi:hypothetical protein